MDGFLDEYEITEDGFLMRHAHERKWRDDPDSLLGGTMVSLRDWWEKVPDIHGDVRIYTSEGTPGEPEARRIEIRIRFTNGRVQEVREVEASPPASGGAELAGG